jgi:hypothetical protein
MERYSFESSQCRKGRWEFVTEKMLRRYRIDGSAIDGIHWWNCYPSVTLLRALRNGEVARGRALLSRCIVIVPRSVTDGQSVPRPETTLCYVSRCCATYVHGTSSILGVS